MREAMIGTMAAMFIVGVSLAHLSGRSAWFSS
jgi:hypothetical protein